MNILEWLVSPHKASLATEKEATRQARGGLAVKVVELDHARNNLDEMVKRSLALLEGGKK